MGWMKFALSEGIAKSVGSFFQKIVGKVMETVEMGCVAGIIIGTVQMIGGLIGFVHGARKDPEHISALVPDIRSVSWALLFGFFAAIPGTVWSVYTFTLGADLAIRTLLISCAIIPGAVIGRIIWKDPLGIWEVMGIVVFLAAVWAMFDFTFAFPLWAWAVLVITFTQPINEALSRAASVKLNIWVNNFWVGVSTVFCCLTLLAVLGFLWGGVQLNLSKMFLFGSIVIGGIVLGMISFKLLAYAGGGTIALKKLVMQGTYLVTAAIGGILFFNEPMTVGKVIGILLFPIALALSDRAARSYIFSVLRRQPKEETV